MAIAAIWVVTWFALTASEGFLGTLTFLMTLLFTPLSFVVSHLLAVLLVEQGARREVVHQQTRSRQHAAAEADLKAQRLAEVARNDRLTRIKNARKEIIDRLGMAGQFIDLLPGTTDSDRRVMILQDIKKEFRELVVRYPLQDLVALIRSDEAIRLKLPPLRQTLAQHRIESDDAQILFEALRRAQERPR